jgi:hypothetical protein
MAIAIGKTTGGQLEQFKNQVDDSKEAVGGFLAYFVGGYLDWARNFVSGLNLVWQGMKDLWGIWNDIVHLRNPFGKDSTNNVQALAERQKALNEQFRIFEGLAGSTAKKTNSVAVAHKELGKEIKANTEKMGVFFYRADSGWSEMVNDMTTGATGIVDGWSKIANEMGKVETFFLPQSDLRKGIKDTTEEMTKQYTDMIMLSKSVFDELGRALVTNGASWNDLGEVAVHAIGKIVSALGDQLAAEAAKSLVRAFAALASIIGAPLAPGYFAAAAIEAAGAAAAWTAGAALQAINFAKGGDFTVPPGYPDDSYPMRVQSGEHVSVTPAGQGGDMIHVVVNLDSQPILDAVTRGSKNRRVLISARSVV